MNPNPAQSRADEVWRRFVGMFGGEVVERRYGLIPPPEWVAMVGRLKDFEVDRGIRRLAFSGRDSIPSLPAFTKLCRTVQDEAMDEGMRPANLPALDTRQMDRWDIAGNNRLLAHILRCGVKRRYFDPDQTAILVAHKNAWTRDMREGIAEPETGAVGEYTQAQQQTYWDEGMRRADEEMAAAKILGTQRARVA